MAKQLGLFFIIVSAQCMLGKRVMAEDSAIQRPKENLGFEESYTTGQPNLFVYSESTYFPKDDNVVFSTKLNYTFLRLAGISNIYLGLEYGQDLQSDATNIYNDNHIAPLIGANIRPLPLPISFFTEYRQQIRAFNRPDIRRAEESDFRLGAYGYNWWDLFQLSAFFQPFSEAYGEAIFTTMLDDDLLIQFWSKNGIRFKLNQYIFADGFGELILTRDSTSYFWNNYQMSGLGLRAGFRIGNTLAQLMIRRNFPLFSDLPANQSLWNGQLVLSAEI